MAAIKIDDYTWHYVLLGGMQPMPIYVIKYCGWYRIMPAIYHELQDVRSNPFYGWRSATLEKCEQLIDAHLDKLEREKNIIKDKK